MIIFWILLNKMYPHLFYCLFLLLFLSGYQKFKITHVVCIMHLMNSIPLYDYTTHYSFYHILPTFFYLYAGRHLPEFL